MCHLPEDLLSNVLSRLPLKSLRRFTCASKLWLNLIIESPYFARLHGDYHKDSDTTHLKIMIRGYDKNDLYFYSLDFNLQNDYTKVASRKLIKSPLSGDFTVVGSCNGLICLAPLPGKNIVFWNPITNKRRQGPLVSDPWCKFAFGYDQISQDYKMVHVATVFNDKSKKSNFKIYSLKSDSWSCERTTNPLNVIYPPTFVSGAVYFLAEDYLIVAIDLATGDGAVFRGPVMPQPYQLGTLGGSLCATRYSWNRYSNVLFDVWLMRSTSEGDKKYDWHKLFSVDKGVCGFKYGMVNTLAYVGSDRKVLIYDSGVLMWYDIDKRTVKKVDLGDVHMEPFSYCESLVAV